MDERGRAGLGTLVFVAFLAALVWGGNWLLTTGRPLIDGGPLSGIFAGDTVRRSVTGWLNGGSMPPPQADAQETRILPAVRPPADPGEYAFLRREGGTPVTYSPCRRLEVVVNTAGAPPEAMPVVADAVAQISRASGLSITVAGETREQYRAERKPYQPGRYGERWAPILIAWAGPNAVPEFQQAAVGLGGSLAIDTALSDPAYVTGSIVLDREFFADPGNHGYLSEVVLHEMGHVVGLDHVSDESQIMWEGGLHGAQLGSGDLAGLAKAGRGECTPDL